MFDEIRTTLGTSKLQPTGQVGGGCINEGEVYETDHGKVFIKRNSNKKAREMFEGEHKSLEAIEATGTIKCPVPHVVVDNPAGGAVLVMEYIEMHSLRNKASKLGEQLAELHLHNEKNKEKSILSESRIGATPKYIDKFGFEVPTCCGSIPQGNVWLDDWVVYYSKKLEEQIKLLESKGDRELNNLWSELQLKIPQFFTGLDVTPSLLHGDLWSGNAAETSDVPVIYDPASFYGHHEYDLGIMKMFGGFSSSFWDSYHTVIPKGKGFSKRIKLYELFHNLNHWNHFGSGYRSGSLQIIRSLL